MARNRRSNKRSGDYEPLDVGRLTQNWRRTEQKRGREWTVQPISEQNALKVYICPGCHGDIQPGISHIVAWRNDGVLGDLADMDGRRHWHSACWKVS